MCASKRDPRDQLIVTLYTLSIHPTAHRQLFQSFRTLFEAHIVNYTLSKLDILYQLSFIYITIQTRYVNFCDVQIYVYINPRCWRVSLMTERVNIPC